MRNIDKKILSYYLYFRTIKDHDKKVVARVKGNTILSNDEEFLENVSSGKYGLQMDESLKYNIYSIKNNKVVAKEDKHLNTYSLNGVYSGTLYDMTKFLRIVVGCIVLALITICLVFTNIAKTSSDVKPISLIVSEIDGGIVSTEWNIFGKYKDDKVIYPGKKGEYYFELINKNSKALNIDINLDEVNEYSIPMIFKLNLHESDNSNINDYYVPANSLELNNIYIPANSSRIFKLEWYWKNSGTNDKDDTQIASTGLATYTVKITVKSVLVYE